MSSSGVFGSTSRLITPASTPCGWPPRSASAWKTRLRRRKEPVRVQRLSARRRSGYLDVLSTVWAFYLDLAEWALEDPARWGPWVAPCPIRKPEMSRRKFVRQRKARIDARTRERLPLLPQLVHVAEKWRQDAEALLVAGRAASPGEEFSAAGETLVRSTRIRPRIEGNIWADGPESGKRRLLNREEEHAFWAWAVIEVLRFTGVRVEELLELNHYSLVKYRLPTTGELVPLLRIAPSKTDAERLLVVCPELSEVLSAVICRFAARTGQSASCGPGTTTKRSGSPRRRFCSSTGSAPSTKSSTSPLSAASSTRCSPAQASWASMAGNFIARRTISVACSSPTPS